MELEIRIEPHSSSMNYYIILYRYKKRFNIFNRWKKIMCVWDFEGSLDYDQPLLFSTFKEGVEYGMKLKNNPGLLQEHYERQDKKYAKALQRNADLNNSRNKSITF